MDEQIRATLAARWEDRTRAELASARTMQELASKLTAVLGPSALTQALLSASRDEAHHAVLCSEVVTQLGGTPPVDGDNVGLPPTRASDPHGALLENVVFLLCTGETIAATLLDQLAAQATAGDISERLARIARDERGHSVLGWKVLDALLADMGPSQRAALAPAVARQTMLAVITYERAKRTTSDEAGRAWGLTSSEDVSAIAKSVVGRDVVPNLHKRGVWPLPTHKR